LFGFDILLDAKLNPYVLEVNHRPSLAHGTAAENAMKLDLLTGIFRIFLPASYRHDMADNPTFTASAAQWNAFLDGKPSPTKFAKVLYRLHRGSYERAIKRSMGNPINLDESIQCPMRYSVRRQARASKKNGRVVESNDRGHQVLEERNNKQLREVRRV
jgi:hypothetical protein